MEEGKGKGKSKAKSKAKRNADDLRSLLFGCCSTSLVLHLVAFIASSAFRWFPGVPGLATPTCCTSFVLCSGTISEFSCACGGPT